MTLSRSQTQKYDFAGWRKRMGLNKTQVEKVLAVAQATWKRLEASGRGDLIYIWACIGVELYSEKQRKS